MTNGKTIAFTRWTFVGKVKSLFFNMLSRLVIAFLACVQVSSSQVQPLRAERAPELQTSGLIQCSADTLDPVNGF